MLILQRPCHRPAAAGTRQHEAIGRRRGRERGGASGEGGRDGAQWGEYAVAVASLGVSCC